MDNSNIIRKARKIASENKLDDRITFIQGKVEEVILPVDKVDVIISEWMGYFLLFEGMLDSVLAARDKWLKPDGIMAPSNTTILIAAVSDEEWYNDKYHFWNNVYGFSMPIMKNNFLRDAQVDYADQKTICSKPVSIQSIDTETTTCAALDFKSDFIVVVEITGVVHALCGWFDTEFSGHSLHDVNRIVFSTGPASTRTHWKQTLFVFAQPIKVTIGDTISGTFKCTKSESHHRELKVEIEYCASGSGQTGTQLFNVR